MSNANTQITNALTAGNVTPIVGQSLPGQTFTLTPNIDSPTQGFTTGSGATATAANSVFNASYVVETSGLANNTLNTGDDLETTGAAVGATTLNYTASPNGIAANPPFAVGVTLNGVNQANISNQSAVKAGFQGAVTGLTTVNSVNSLATVQVGNVAQGLDATGPVLANVGISGYAGAAGSTAFAAYIAAAAGAATNALTVTTTGPLGTTAAADHILIANDGAAGTATAPNLSYGTQTYVVNSNANLELLSNGVDGTTAFVFKGAGNLTVGQDAPGNHQFVTSIDASGTTGTVIITGADSGGLGSATGFLNDPTPGSFALTSFKLGTGVDRIDVSSANLAEVAALTTIPGANTQTTNEIDVNNHVLDTISAATFKDIAGFQIAGVSFSGPAGTPSIANVVTDLLLPTSINDIKFLDTEGKGGSFTLNNLPSGGTFTVDGTCQRL